MLTPAHLQELTASGIDPELAALNFRSLSGESTYDFLFCSPDLERLNSGRVSAEMLRVYAHIPLGGWWCSGIDPLNQWRPMEWGCMKPDEPRRNEKDKPIKYEHPPRTPTRLFCLDVPPLVWEQIAVRYGVPAPFAVPAVVNGMPPEASFCSFWQWVYDHDLPIILCEGAKKAACLLSQGYIAIALPGIVNGYRSLRGQGTAPTRTLIPDLQFWLTPGRPFYICFDFETRATTLRDVQRAIRTTGWLIQQHHPWAQRNPVFVIDLPGPQKGVDDLIVAQGLEVFSVCYERALSLPVWSHAHPRSTTQVDLSLNQPRLDIEHPMTGLVVLQSAVGTGKTSRLLSLAKAATAQGQRVLVIDPVVLDASRLTAPSSVGLAPPLPSPTPLSGCYAGFELTPEGYHWLTLGDCLQADWNAAVVLVDDADLLLRDVFFSPTLKRFSGALLSVLSVVCRSACQSGGLVVVQGESLPSVLIRLFADWAAATPWFCRNCYQPDAAAVHIHADPAFLLAHVQAALSTGQRAIVWCDAEHGRWNASSLAAAIAQPLPHLRVAVLDEAESETFSRLGAVHTTEAGAQLHWASEAELILVPPTAGTRFSLRQYGCLDAAFIFYTGQFHLPQVMGLIERFAMPVHLWSSATAPLVGNRADSNRTFKQGYLKTLAYSLSLLLEQPHLKHSKQVAQWVDTSVLDVYATFSAQHNRTAPYSGRRLMFELEAAGHTINRVSLPSHLKPIVQRLKAQSGLPGQLHTDYRTALKLALFQPDLARQWDLSVLSAAIQSGAGGGGLIPTDFPLSFLLVQVLRTVGLPNFVSQAGGTLFSVNDLSLQQIHQLITVCKPDLAECFGLTFPEPATPLQVVGILLARVGLRFEPVGKEGDAWWYQLVGIDGQLVRVPPSIDLDQADSQDQAAQLQSSLQSSLQRSRQPESVSTASVA